METFVKILVTAMFPGVLGHLFTPAVQSIKRRFALISIDHCFKIAIQKLFIRLILSLYAVQVPLIYVDRDTKELGKGIQLWRRLIEKGG